VVRKLEKSSNNFIAEQILKTLGAEKKGPPGTWRKGVEAVEDFLAEAGIPRGSYVMRNGSGLNDANRFSARQTVTLLREMWRRFPVMADFLAALPVAGKDGTTRWRMESTEGRLRAKTGTLEGVTSLSGYVETAGRERLVFSILVNDYPGRAHLAVRGVDAVGTALAAAGGRPIDMGAAIASATPPPAQVDETFASVKAHLATYYQLGRAGDARNVPFLRASLKAERDPVLRMAAAEAVYLSDPDSESARRAFLDTLAADAASFARLRAAGGELESPSPVVGSLADLAAQGHPEAMSRLVELSAAAMADPALVERFSELWEDVSRNAPIDVLPALRSAPPAGGDAALAAIARGIARTTEPDHPFPALVRTLAAAGQAAADRPAASAASLVGVATAAQPPGGAAADAARDPELVAYARTLQPRLEQQLAAARAVLEAGPPRIGPIPSPGKPAPAGAPASAPDASRAAPADAEARVAKGDG
jgi:D-alanyl-D-alanine carboxypeptidase/D-alanyl-D-alanine-endopeptidase (penicillin-binding protein 4)